MSTVVIFGETADADVSSTHKDTWIADGAFRPRAWGTNATLYSGKIGAVNSWSMIRFDLSSLSTDSVVESAELRLVCAVDSVGAGGLTLDMCSLLTAWGVTPTAEGATENPATGGQATYDNAFDNNGADTGWNAGEDAGFGAGDYAATETTIVVPFGGGVGAVYTTQIPLMVQVWITTPAANYGLGCIRSAGDDYVEFDSQESTTQAERPKLTVTCVDRPVVTDVCPDTSRLAGGGEVIITGTDFEAAQGTGTVKVDGTLCTAVTWSDTEITCALPAKAEGSHTLTVMTNYGISATYSSIVYADPGTPILTNAEAQMLALVDGMSVVSGYHYDWGDSDQPDDALDTAVNAVIDRADSPFEQNDDDPDGAHAGAYLNMSFYRVTVRGELTTEESLPRWKIMAVWNKLLDDLKKRFGSGDGSTLNGVVQHMQYMKADIFLEEAGDQFKPGRMETTWSVRYIQDRVDPSVNG